MSNENFLEEFDVNNNYSSDLKYDDISKYFLNTNNDINNNLVQSKTEYDNLSSIQISNQAENILNHLHHLDSFSSINNIYNDSQNTNNNSNLIIPVMNTFSNLNKLNLNMDIVEPEDNNCSNSKDKKNSICDDSFYTSSSINKKFYSHTSDIVTNIIENKIEKPYSDHNIKRRIFSKLRNNIKEDLNSSICRNYNNLLLLGENTTEFKQKVDIYFLKEYGLQPIKNYFAEKEFQRSNQRKSAMKRNEKLQLEKNIRVVEAIENLTDFPEITEKFNRSLKEYCLLLLKNEKFMNRILQKDLVIHEKYINKKMKYPISHRELKNSLEIYSSTYLKVKDSLIEFFESLC